MPNETEAPNLPCRHCGHAVPGPVLGIVETALVSWACRMNPEAVNCGHSYCREHELVRRLDSAMAQIAVLSGEEWIRTIQPRADPRIYAAFRAHVKTQRR